MYFNRGSLPWQGLKAATKRQKYELISEKKLSTSIEELCKVRVFNITCSIKNLSKISMKNEDLNYFRVFLPSLHRIYIAVDNLDSTIDLIIRILDNYFVIYFIGRDLLVIMNLIGIN